MLIDEREVLMIPGPTQVPPPIKREMSKEMISHRGPEFVEMMSNLIYKLKWVFQTKKGEVFVYTSSGTGAIEAAIVNTFSPGDKVLCVSHGFFGERVIEMTRTFQLDVRTYEVNWGEAPDINRVIAILKEGGFKGVFLTHNDTSTGVQIELKDFAEAIKSEFPEVLIFVDAVSSLASAPLYFDDWGLDLVVAASQKGLAVAPGIAFLAVSPMAREAMKHSTMPRYYWDVERMERFLRKGQTPFTPALPQFFGLNKALDFLIGNGLAESIRRHVVAKTAVRRALTVMGLELLVKSDRIASNVVTTVKVPKEIKSVNELLWLMKYKYGVEIAGAFGPLAGKAFRIGHLGFVRGWDVISTISALESSLRELGYPLDERIDRSVPDEMTPVAAAQKVFIYAPEVVAYTKNHVSFGTRRD